MRDFFQRHGLSLLALILMALVVVFALPIYHYFREFSGDRSSDPNDWIAFGGLFYGLAIVVLTGFNIWLTERANRRAHLMQQQSIYSEEDRSRRRNQMEAIGVFEGIRKRMVEGLKNVNDGRYTDVPSQMDTFVVTHALTFENSELLGRLRQFSRDLEVHFKQLPSDQVARVMHQQNRRQGRAELQNEAEALLGDMQRITFGISIMDIERNP